MGRNPLVRRPFQSRQVRRQRHVRPGLERLEDRSLLSSTGDPTSLAPSLGPPPSPGPNVIWVNTQSALQNAFSNLKSGQTIVIQPGTYNLSSTLYIGLNSQITNVTVRGSTDNFNDVLLLGNGMDNSSYGNVPMGISVWNAQNVTIADLSIGNIYDDPIEIKGDAGANAVTIYHDRLYDAGEQFIKVDPPSSGVGTSNSAVEYSLIEYTNGPPTTDHGGGVGYTNGIDIHDGQNWDIKSNLIRNLHAPDADSSNLWDPAILVWQNSSNVTTEGNTVINCDRAIAYGLGIDRPAGMTTKVGSFATTSSTKVQACSVPLEPLTPTARSSSGIRRARQLTRILSSPTETARIPFRLAGPRLGPRSRITSRMLRSAHATVPRSPRAAIT